MMEKLHGRKSRSSPARTTVFCGTRYGNVMAIARFRHPAVHPSRSRPASR